MSAFIEAVEAFVGQLAAVRWLPLAIALGFHLLKTATRAQAWRNIIVAAYPQTRVPFATTFGAYVAGVAVNAVSPARGGDLVKLFLVKRSVRGSSYATLAATLFVETLFDVLVATALLVWAIQLGVLPGAELIPDLRAVDWSLPFRHPSISVAIAGGVLLVVLLTALVARERLAAFRRRLLQGFAILRDWRRYVARVVSWQALSWVFRLATVYFFLQAFGLVPGLNTVVIVQVVQSLSSALPLTPGGAGTEQALTVYALAGEVSTSSLLAFSVGMQAVLLLFNVVLGFAAILLMLKTLRWRGVIDREKELHAGRSGPARDRPRQEDWDHEDRSASPR